MTARTPTYLKARFEQGDIPQGTDYEDVFDSYVNVATSAIQTVVGGMVFTNQIYASESNAALVSATSGVFSFVSAQTVNAGFMSAGVIDASRVSANSVFAASATFTNANITTVSADSINVSGAVIFGTFDISAVATTQASAITLNGTTNFVIYADGSNLAVKLPTSVRGRRQQIINAASTTLKIFPATSGRFLVTAVNASLNLPADKTALVFHKGDDRYGIVIGGF